MNKIIRITKGLEAKTWIFTFSTRIDLQEWFCRIATQVKQILGNGTEVQNKEGWTIAIELR